MSIVSVENNCCGVNYLISQKKWKIKKVMHCLFIISVSTVAHVEHPEGLEASRKVAFF